MGKQGMHPAFLITKHFPVRDQVGRPDLVS